MIKLTSLTTISFVVLTACSNAPASTNMDLRVDPNGNFAGTTNASMTADEIKSLVQGSVCGPNRVVADFVTNTGTSAAIVTTFSGRCVGS